MIYSDLFILFKRLQNVVLDSFIMSLGKWQGSGAKGFSRATQLLHDGSF
jgi:hypothetical protein